MTLTVSLIMASAMIGMLILGMPICIAIAVSAVIAYLPVFDTLILSNIG